MRHVTDEEIEQRVRVLRREIGLQNQIRPDMMTVIERLTTSFRHFNYQRIPDSEMPNAEAQWDAGKGLLRMRESVVGAIQRGEPRARMAIANEIGHFAMRHVGVRTRSAAPNDRRETPVGGQEGGERGETLCGDVPGS